MLGTGQGVVSTAFDRGVVDDNQAFLASDAANAGDDAGTGYIVVVALPGGKLRKFQEGAAGIEQVFKAVAGQQFATALMAVARLLVTTEAELGDLLVQVVDDALHLRGVVGKLGSAGVDLRFQYGHGSDSLRLLLLELVLQGSVFL